jgi:hypothetical protein
MTLVCHDMRLSMDRQTHCLEPLLDPKRIQSYVIFVSDRDIAVLRLCQASETTRTLGTTVKRKLFHRHT